MPQQSMTFQQQFPQLFQEALSTQREKRWDDAISKYRQILDQSHNSISNEQASVIYHNMAVCAYEKSEAINAYIWSKKALTLDRSNTFAQSLFQEASKKFQPVQIPHQISALESLQKVGLKNVSFDVLLIGFLLLLGFSVFLGLKSWLLKKKNQLESESLSVQKKQPLGLLVGLTSMLTLTAVFLFLVVMKWNDLSIPKAIITASNASVQTASGGNQAVIYEASPGLEVDVLKIESEYVQIRYPGAFSGWVSKNNLEILTAPTW